MPRQYNKKTINKGWFKKGHAPTNTEEGIAKSSGKNHYKWQGDNAGYYAQHVWLKKIYGGASKCENPDCVYPRKNRARRWLYAPKTFHWALIHGRKYTKNRDDYMMLCPSCHVKYDMNLITINI